MSPHTNRRVVITGLGTVSALGAGARALWEGLVEGRSGLRPITAFDASGFRARLGGEVEGFSAREFVPKHYRKAVKVMARDTELAVGAALLAAEDAKLSTRAAVDESVAPTYPGERVGCQIGAGLIAAETAELALAAATAVDEQGRFSTRLWGTVAESGGAGGMDNLQPLWMLKYLPNMLACHVTIIHGCEGPSNTITCAEASGLLSLGESVRVIQRGAADACFSGGAESKLNHMGMIRLDLAGRLAATGDAADGSAFVRPFDPAAPGTLLGEGGGVLILEEAECAARRGARVYAEVAGFGAAHGGPPYDVIDTEASPGERASDGLRWAIEAALADAAITPDQIDAIVPTGAGVAHADAAEAEALRAVFGTRLEQIPLVTIRPNVGDCQAGNGALQAAVAAMCLSDQRLPARVQHGSPATGLQAGAASARAAPLECVLVCTTSLGGQNAALVLRATDAASAAGQG
jgi:3-oxoacyl-[acyl-carrier-protein] synthase II